MKKNAVTIKLKAKRPIGAGFRFWLACQLIRLSERVSSQQIEVEVTHD